MTTSAQTSTHSFGRTVSTGTPLARPRPDLPSWFRGATTSLYAACASLAFLLAGLALITLGAPAPDGTTVAVAQLLGVFQLATVLSAAGWCHTIAHSCRVDPTTPQLKPIWFILAWFIPFAHLFVPHRMFGDLWASAKWQQSDRHGTNSPLARRPWIISAWACAWGLFVAWTIVGSWLTSETTYFVALLGLSTAWMSLLGGVVHVIAKEISGPAIRG